MPVDWGSPGGLRTAARLAAEQVVWLTTVSSREAPVPSPVWFLWTGDQVLVASQPGKPKLRNVTARPRVTLHFNTDPHGGDVQVLSGAAALDPAGLAPAERQAYDTKYGASITGLGMANESFHAEYSEIIRIDPDRLRSY